MIAYGFALSEADKLKESATLYREALQSLMKEPESAAVEHHKQTATKGLAEVTRRMAKR